ncbi:hypothetical protein [Deinococcus sp.]|uniref:DUF6630 family protein n=1 Tax=Deinococcus sp. TaxID=47478 RepID=UPI0025D9FFC3|nr:hypothetical protein [Deinococcus sp.]
MPRPARQPPSDTPTLDVLGEASEWLRAQGYNLLHLDTGGDEYLAVPIRRDLLTQAQAAAGRLNIPTSVLWIQSEFGGPLSACAQPGRCLTCSAWHTECRSGRSRYRRRSGAGQFAGSWP